MDCSAIFYSGSMKMRLAAAACFVCAVLQIVVATCASVIITDESVGSWSVVSYNILITAP
jgi:hypothetical protein